MDNIDIIEKLEEIQTNIDNIMVFIDIKHHPDLVDMTEKIDVIISDISNNE